MLTRRRDETAFNLCSYLLAMCKDLEGNTIGNLQTRSQMEGKTEEAR